MDLQNETGKLELAKQMFKIQNLTKQQAEFTLGRKLSDNAWQAYMTSESRKHRNTVQHLSTDTKVI